jgi:hypothetical protein
MDQHTAGKPLFAAVCADHAERGSNMGNPEIAREIDPAWFQPQKNHNEYTQGYFKGRDYERKRIVAILHDWPLNVRLDWADIYQLIDEGMDYRQLTMSPALLDDYKTRAAQIERERLFDAVKGYFDSISARS